VPQGGQVGSALDSRLLGIEFPNVESAISNLTSGVPYHFVVTAYDAVGVESGLSNDAGPPDFGQYRKPNPVTGAPLNTHLLDFNFHHPPDV